MFQRPTPGTLAAFFYALVAAAFVGKWVIFLFIATPDGQAITERVSYLLAFLFAEHGDTRSWAMAFAVLTIANLSLATLSVIGRNGRPGLRTAILVAGVGLIPPTLVWSVMVVPASIAAAYYSYAACREARRTGTKQS